MLKLKLDWKQWCCWVGDLNAINIYKFLKFVTYRLVGSSTNWHNELENLLKGVFEEDYVVVLHTHVV